MAPYPAQKVDGSMRKKLLKQAEYFGSALQLVNVPHDVGIHNGKHEVLVEWEGWDDLTNRTGEPFAYLKTDIPGMVRDFLKTSRQRNIKARVLDDYYQ